MKKYNFEVDSHRILEWINLTTLVHNEMIKGESFCAGFNLCFLQQCMIEVMKELEKKEKNNGKIE